MSDELIHYGKKGMKWGVRGVHLAKVAKTTNRLDRVAKGTATRREKIGTLATTPFIDLALNKGLRGAAAAQSAELKAHAHRISSGKARTSDTLRMYGHLSLLDIAKAQTRKK